MKRLATLIALVLILAACSASDASDETGRFEDQAGGFAEAPAATLADSGEDVPTALNVQFDVVDNRQVIRRASLQLHASDTRAAFDEIIRLTEIAGGFVANANVFPFQGEDAQPEVSMTVRIPAGQLNSTMNAIKKSVDEVVSESQSAQDVTEQFVDLEARLTNLSALEIELRALLAEVRQQSNADPEKLLTIFHEISSTRGQIEQIEGQLNLLSDLTALATLEVQISQTPTAVPVVGNTWAPGEVAKDALRSLVSGLQDVADWTISFAVFTLPMLLLTLALPALIGWFVYRRIRDQRESTPTESAPAES